MGDTTEDISGAPLCGSQRFPSGRDLPREDTQPAGATRARAATELRAVALSFQGRQQGFVAAYLQDFSRVCYEQPGGDAPGYRSHWACAATSKCAWRGEDLDMDL